MRFRSWGAGLMLAFASLASWAADPVVGIYTQVSNKRVSATVWEFVLTAKLTNSGPALADVKATLRSNDPLVTIVDGQLEFGDVPAGATMTSRDTFTIRYDRSKALDESKLVWTVTGTPALVPDFTVPLNGAPVGVAIKFMPSTAVPVAKYEWDFNGDGVIDVTDTAGTEQSWTYAAAGSYNVRLTVRDAAGRAAMTAKSINVTAAAPQITGLSPKDVSVPADAKPRIAAAFSDATGIDTATARILFNGTDVTSQASVSAQGVSFTPMQPLQPGPQTVHVMVRNLAGTTRDVVWGFDVETPRSYSVVVKDPAGGMSVVAPRLTVVAEALGDPSYAKQLLLNDKPMDAVGVTTTGAQRFSGELDLIDGRNTVTVTAVFSDDVRRTSSVEVDYDAPVRITVISPADKAVLGRLQATSPGNLTGAVERPTEITGRLTKPVESVTINQQRAELDGSGLNFTFPRFFLHEGANLLTVVATDAKGRASTAAINVSVDQTAPILNVEQPRDGTVTRAAWVDVRGMVNDAVEAIFGAPEPKVFITVNGQTEQAAAVADRYFALSRVALDEGLNQIKVRAVDHLGNERVQTLAVHKADTGLAGLLIVDGHDQAAPGRTELPKALTVLALDAAGEPVRHTAVDFVVERGTGALSGTPGQTASGNANYTARAISVRTDAQGRASAWFTVGKQSGPGANVVSAKAAGLGGEAVQFTANTQRGEPARLRADLGINQISETDAPVMEILSAVVRDAGNNYLPNVKVEFRVAEGDAFFVDQPGAAASSDGKSIVLTTDKNGLVGVRPNIGREPGIVRINARAAKGDNFEGPDATVGGASFTVRSKKAADGPASFGGFIYSDKGAPLEGVKVSIGRTALLATSDDKGYFEIANVPPGRIDLFVDGRAINPANDPAKPQWPSLHFEAYVVRGQKNELPHAIYLPALLISEAKVVGGNEDVVLTIPGLEGFSMKVKANSVTFPDGSRTGMLVVSPVTADKLPMAPPSGGAQFGVPAWTIQPAGTRFDPPIEVQMPNSTLEEPGDNLPVVQWDHDLAQYVPMGRATVSSDGAWLMTDAGSGVTKAGWGGLCRYDDCKTAATKCSECQMIATRGSPPCPTCVTDPAKQMEECGGNKCKRCKGGNCEKAQEADGNKIGSVGGQLAIAGEIGSKAKVITRSLGVVFDLGGNFGAQYSGEERCCYRKASGTGMKLEVTGGGQLEGAVGVPLLPVLKKVSTLVFGDLISGPSIVMRGNVGGSVAGNYDECPDQFDVLGKVTGALEFLPLTFSNDLKVKQKNLNGSVSDVEGNFRPLDVGLSGNFGWNVRGMSGRSIPFEGDDAYVQVFVKSSIQYGLLNWTILDLQIPIWQGKTPSFTIGF